MSEYIITDKMRAWGTANGFNVDLHHEFFVDYLANKTGKPYRDLDAAFRQCVRSDWGNIRRQAQYANKPKQDWRFSDEGIIQEGRRLKIDSRPGETMNSYKARLEAAQ